MELLVKVSYPLKQGLKQYFPFLKWSTIGEVKVSYPLKQGLKQLKIKLRLLPLILKLK